MGGEVNGISQEGNMERKGRESDRTLERKIKEESSEQKH